MAWRIVLQDEEFKNLGGLLEKMRKYPHDHNSDNPHECCQACDSDDHRLPGPGPCNCPAGELRSEVEQAMTIILMGAGHED